MRKRNLFLKKLKGAFEPFVFGEAVRLSVEISDAECSGYQITKEEDSLWLQLTCRIEETRDSRREYKHKSLC